MIFSHLLTLCYEQLHAWIMIRVGGEYCIIVDTCITRQHVGGRWQTDSLSEHL
jgi:hypothetical protein